jgi:hypothetical protein
MKTLHRYLAVAALTAASLSAQAHYLWIESSADKVMLRFGEFAENQRERSPGRLDEIVAPQAQSFSGSGPAPVALKREADGFAFTQTGKNAELIAEEKRMGVRDWSGSGIGIVKPMFYARATGTNAAVKPAMQLDIVPTGSADQFKVWFKDQPLAKSAVTVYAPNGWWQEHKTDANGNVALARPWRGQYVIEVIFLEKAAGTFEGKTYNAVRHRATLTVNQPNGPETFSLSAR